jgi:hypothetical protein
VINIIISSLSLLEPQLTGATRGHR